MKLLKTLLFALFMSALVWAGVIWHWQQVQRDVGLRDVLLYLVLAPVVLVGAVLLLRRGVVQATRPQAAVGESPTLAAAPVSTPRPSFQVLAHGVALPGADEGLAALELAVQGPPLELDTTLTTVDGLGIFSRRCADVEPDVVGSSDGMPSGLARALALAERCVQPVLHHLQETSPGQAAITKVETRSEEGRHRPVELPRAPLTLARPTLRLLWGMDLSRPEDEREAMQAAAASRMETWASHVPGFDWRLETVAVPSGAALLLHAEKLLQLAGSGSGDERLLVLASQSLLDEALVEQLDAAESLMTAQRPHGLMLGEAAVALLLAPWPAAGAAGVTGKPALRVHVLSAQRVGTDAAASERTGVTSSQIMRHALDAAQVASGDVSLVVSDTDLRRTQGAELFKALQLALPDISGAEQCRRMGSVAGSVGIVDAPMTLALAAAHVHSRQKPALMLSHAHPSDRLAAVLTLDEAASPSAVERAGS